MTYPRTTIRRALKAPGARPARAPPLDSMAYRAIMRPGTNPCLESDHAELFGRAAGRLEAPLVGLFDGPIAQPAKLEVEPGGRQALLEPGRSTLRPACAHVLA